MKPQSTARAKPPLKMKPNMDLLQPPLPPPPQQQYHSTASLPAVPVTLYDGAPHGNMSRSVDSGYPRHVPRYASSPAGSTTSSHRSNFDQNSFASEHSHPDSTRSNTSRRNNNNSNHHHQQQLDYYEGSSGPVYSASPRTTPRSDNAYYTPDAMMAQMIKMNIMAEKAQQLVEENDRLARQRYGQH